MPKITQAVLNAAFGALGSARTLSKGQREKFGAWLLEHLRDALTERASKILAEHIGRLPSHHGETPLAEIIADVLEVAGTRASRKELVEELSKRFSAKTVAHALLDAIRGKKTKATERSKKAGAMLGGCYSCPPSFVGDKQAMARLSATNDSVARQDRSRPAHHGYVPVGSIF